MAMRAAAARRKRAPAAPTRDWDREFKANTVMDLSFADLNERDGLAIAERLGDSRSAGVLRLRLRGTGLREAAGVAIARAVATNRTLLLLDLSRNALGDGTGVAMAEALARNTKLQSLDLGRTIHAPPLIPPP